MEQSVYPRKLEAARASSYCIARETKTFFLLYICDMYRDRPGQLDYCLGVFPWACGLVKLIYDEYT